MVADSSLFSRSQEGDSLSDKDQGLKERDAAGPDGAGHGRAAFRFGLVRR